MSVAAASSASHNVARFLEQRASDSPGALAAAAPGHGGFAQQTWRDLEERASAAAHGLCGLGLRAGDRACVFVKPGLDWLALVHGLFKLGAVPVLIDPGMGRPALLRSIERARPRALIAVGRVHLARRLYPRAFATVEIAVQAGFALPWSGPSLQSLLARRAGPFPAIARAKNDTAAILFTSGSTGPAKGVVYEHGMFEAQVESLRRLYAFEPGSADLACFPLFALFGAALELASIFPDMDFTRPADCEPARIAEALERFHVRSSFGSPAIWRRVVPWCEAQGRRLPFLHQVMIAGAPVEAGLVRRARAVIAPGGEVFTPYGATEALPVAHVGGGDLAGSLGERAERGEGTCVGRAAPGVELRLIRIDDAPIARWSDALRVGPKEAGEICVRGDLVTREYAFDPGATEAAKILDGEGFWHRMGDCGRFDADGLLWFLGRKAHRIESARGRLFPVPLENVFASHPLIGRCAVVGAGARGSEIPVLIVESDSGDFPRSRRLRAKLATDLLRAGLWFDGCSAVERVLYKPSFPVDPRHQAKIDRTALKAWAEDRMA